MFHPAKTLQKQTVCMFLIKNLYGVKHNTLNEKAFCCIAVIHWHINFKNSKWIHYILKSDFSVYFDIAQIVSDLKGLFYPWA